MNILIRAQRYNDTHREVRVKLGLGPACIKYVVL